MGTVFCVSVFAGFISSPFKKKTSPDFFFTQVDRPWSTVARSGATQRPPRGKAPGHRSSGKLFPLFGFGIGSVGSSDGKPILRGIKQYKSYGNLEGFPLMHLFGLVSCNDPCWLGRNKTTMSGWCCTWWANQQKMAIFLAHNEQNEQLARGVQHLPAVLLWKHLGLSCSEDVSFGWKERFFLVEDFGFYTMTFCEVLEVFFWKKSPNILLEHFSLNGVWPSTWWNLLPAAFRITRSSLRYAFIWWPRPNMALKKIGVFKNWEPQNFPLVVQALLH